MGEQIDRAKTEARRARSLGKDAHCRVCHFAQSAALQRSARGIICYEHANAAARRPTVEDHHPIGRANDSDTTVPTPGNMHRLLDARNAAWPMEVRTNPMHDPLTSIAQVTLAARDFSLVIADYAQRIADWLLRLRDVLVTQFGDTWQIVLGLPPLWGEAAP
ncbi:MAG: hypothetical protein M3008_13915 [Chloroflexota bacterium]|nr:hypothetical protein [Chloroflexota bacterium]